jgi:hypothetical protein
MYIFVSSVPPEAVNMSLGLSLAAATNPTQLLVSCPGSEEGSEGKEGGYLSFLGLGSCLEVLT